MKIATLVKRSFQPAEPYEGIIAVEKRLAGDSFLVVMDEGSFLGVLTAEDIVKSPNRLVIDCLHERPRVDIGQEVRSTLGLMKESQNSVLPVFENDEFVGVVTRPVIAEFLSEYYDELNREISDRTAGLALTNEQLNKEIHDRKQAEEALRESEKKYRNLVENINDVIYRLDENGTVTYVSPSIENRFGYHPSELIGKRFAGYIHPEDLPVVRESFPNLLSDDLGSHEYRVMAKSGEFRWIRSSSSPEYDDGRVIGLTGVFVDIDEQKKLEGMLRQAQKMESMGTLAGGIAHEFNNILGIIIGNTELAMDDVPERNPVRECLEEIRSASLRAKDVVRQILGFARESVFKPIRVQIGPIIKETLKTIRASVPATIEIREDISCASDTVMADSSQISQVLIALCANARDAMREQGGVLEITVENTSLDENSASRYEELPPGPYVKLTVKDTGHGIDPEIIERIFDPYFTTGSLADADGMGLATAYGIVKRHKGAIRAESEPGKGAVFEVLCPVAEAEPEQGAGEPEAVPPGAGRILFVDDERSLLKIAKKMLHQFGYSVETKSNPIEALELVRFEPDRFDLIITDMTMPRMSGDKLAQEILSIRPDMPIVLCTGFSEKIDAEKAKAMGIAAYVMKPIKKREIERTIRTVLDKK